MLKIEKITLINYVFFQVQNVTNWPLCLEKVALEPSPMFKVTSLNTIPGNESGNVSLVGFIIAVLSTVKLRNNGHLNNGMHRNNGQSACSGASK